MLLAAFLLAFTAAVAAAEPPSDNAALSQLFEQDQRARSGTDIDWSALALADADRRAGIQAMLVAGEVRTAGDYYHAAMVFQHGDTLADYRLANALATLAMQLEPGNKHYRWLAGASWDRMLMRQLQPQWYGTQYKGDAKGMYLYPVAEDAVTDEDRLHMVGHTLAESREHLSVAAADTGMKVREPAPTIDDLRREAMQKEEP
jgi:hypothetical protein